MWRALFLLLMVARCSTYPRATDLKSATTPLNFDVSVAPDGPQFFIHFKLSFESGDSSGTDLALPTPLYERDKVFPGLKNLKIECSGCQVVDAQNAAHKLIRHAPHTLITVTYDVAQTSDSNEPTVQSGFFYFNGALFAHPEAADQRVLLRVNWNVPVDWKVANSFAAEFRHQEFEGVFNESPIDNLRETAFAAGDLRIHQFIIHDHPVIFATRGRWTLDEPFLATTVKRVIETQREMWRDFDVPYYFVLLLPNGKPCCSRGGHGFTHSFVAYLSEEEYSMERFTHVLAHEHFHYWNGEKIAPKGANEYWFTEGFTDYYARVLNLRSGLSNLSNFISGYNSAIYRYYENPKRNATDEELEKNFSSDSELSQLPYSKGDMIGFEWNAAIREKSRGRYSLDDLMRAIYKKIRETGQGLSKDLVSSTLADFVGHLDANRLVTLALSGELVRPSAQALGRCASLRMNTTGRLEYGYELFTKTHLVEKVVAGSAAERAGLRNGQTITQKVEDWFKPWEQIQIKISSPQGQKWIRFFPQSEIKITYPYYELLNSSKTDADCAAGI